MSQTVSVPNNGSIIRASVAGEQGRFLVTQTLSTLFPSLPSLLCKSCKNFCSSSQLPSFAHPWRVYFRLQQYALWEAAMEFQEAAKRPKLRNNVATSLSIWRICVSGNPQMTSWGETPSPWPTASIPTLVLAEPRLPGPPTLQLHLGIPFSTEFYDAMLVFSGA